MWRKVVGGSLIWLGRSLGKLSKMDRLEKSEAIPLGSTIDDAVRLYGNPLEIEQSDSLPDATEYTFRVSLFHDCVAWEWQGQIHSVVYYPEFSYPDPDLRFMLDAYGDSHGWNVATEGYLYQRQDGAVRLWCSAMPPIGVATTEFWNAKTTFGRENRKGQDPEG